MAHSLSMSDSSAFLFFQLLHYLRLEKKKILFYDTACKKWKANHPGICIYMYGIYTPIGQNPTRVVWGNLFLPELKGPFNHKDKEVKGDKSEVNNDVKAPETV